MHNLLRERSVAVADICRRLRVRKLDVFGSGVSGKFDPASSDLDFLVEFEPMPPAEYAEMYFALKESLEELFSRPVDLVSAKTLVNPYFRASVNASRETIYAG
jgi:uncharacterized protein